MTANIAMAVIANIIFITMLKLRTKDILDAVCFEQFLGKKLNEKEEK